MAGNIYFEIQAVDPGRALNFYKKVFGWRFEAVSGLPVAYWRIETNGARGGLLKRPAKTPPPESGTNAFVCSFEVDDFEAVAKTIHAADGIVALPKFGVPHRLLARILRRYGRQYLRDISAGRERRLSWFMSERLEAGSSVGTCARNTGPVRLK